MPTKVDLTFCLSFFHLRGLVIFTVHPRLAPWATCFRRFAA